MLSHMILMTAVLGQTIADRSPTGPVLSPEARTAQARALAEFRANQHTIKTRLIAQYQLENDRLRDRLRTAEIATRRPWSVTSGTIGEQLERADAFLSVSPTGASSAPARQPSTSLEELRRENFLLKGRLRDSQRLYREAHRMYWTEYPIRYQRAFWGVP